MSKTFNGAWRALIQPLEDERIDLQRVIDKKERWLDLYQSGLITRALMVERVEDIYHSEVRFAKVTRLITEMMQARAEGKDAVLWKLARP